jgi:N-acetylneuraminic acid mutarotase
VKVLFLFLFFAIDKLIPAGKLNEPRKEHAVIRLGMELYVIGGYNGKNNTFLKSCEKYVAKENKWVYIANLNIQRCAFAATPLNGDKILVCGGFDGKKRLVTIEVYLQNSNEWIVSPHKLPLPLSNLAAFNPYRDQIVILGGGLSTGFYLDVEVLNFKNGEWTKIVTLPEGKDLRNKVVYCNYAAYTAGGNNYTAEKLLIDNNQWAPLKTYGLQNNLDSWSCALTFSNNIHP